MKQLSLRFDDKDFKKIAKAKAKTVYTWEGFLLHLVKGGNDGETKD